MHELLRQLIEAIQCLNGNVQVLDDDVKALIALIKKTPTGINVNLSPPTPRP